jgi:Fe-S-cluster containining protein
VTEPLAEYDLSRFVCTQCGNCCRMPGDVRLGDDEVTALAEHLSLDERDFVDTYTRLTTDRRGLSLIDQADGACIFLEKDNSCRVNVVKPKQCRDFPFTWHYTNVVDICPGVQACRQDPDPK